MAKQKHTVPDQYLSWLEHVPEAQREEAKAKWLARDEVKGLANQIGAMNEAQRIAAHYKQQAEYGQQLATSLAPYQDVLPRLHEYASHIRRYQPQEIAAAMGNTQQHVQAQAAISQTQQVQQDIIDKMQTGELDWQAGQREVLRLQQQITEMGSALQEIRTFREAQVPQVLRKWEQNLEALDQRRRKDTAEKLNLTAQIEDYVDAHPGRKRKELYTALIENPDKYPTFDALVAEVYGEDDVEDQIARAREEERAKVKTEYETKHATTPMSGTAPGEGWFHTGESALVRRRRGTEDAKRPVLPRNDAEASEQLQQFLLRRAGQSAA